MNDTRGRKKKVQFKEKKEFKTIDKGERRRELVEEKQDEITLRRSEHLTIILILFLYKKYTQQLKIY